MIAPAIVCSNCSAYFSPDSEPPAVCPLCEDDRGALPRKGQSWTTSAELRLKHHTVTREHEQGLLGIGTEPPIMPGHRALLVQTSEGNVLWDCISLIDEAAIEAVKERGGVCAIAVSHPHFYGAMVEWSHAFNGVPIYLHAADRAWVTYSDPSIVYWEGDTQSLPGSLEMIHCGGHFDGACVLYWGDGANGRGALLTGDPIAVTPDRHVSFMHAYPNYIPLSAKKVRRVVDSVVPYSFETIYGGWFNTRIEQNAKEILLQSAERYLEALEAS